MPILKKKLTKRVVWIFGARVDMSGASAGLVGTWVGLPGAAVGLSGTWPGPLGAATGSFGTLSGTAELHPRCRSQRVFTPCEKGLPIGSAFFPIHPFHHCHQ
jgi:hypothetical protein